MTAQLIRGIDRNTGRGLRDMKKQASALGIPMDVPWREMSEAAREVVLRGKGSFEGVHGFFAQMERKKYKLHVRVMLSKYRGYAECPECRGQRLRAEARAVRLTTENRAEYLPGRGADDREGEGVFCGLKLSPMQEEIAGPILEEVQQRLSFLDAVGLEYLTLDRLASTFLAAKRSGFSLRRRSVRSWWEPCMCWMSLRSDCTRGIRPG